MSPPTLHIVYRSVDGDNGKRRTPWFDKTGALGTFADAAGPVLDRLNITFMNDGEVRAARLHLMESLGTVITLDRVGNSGSYRRALHLLLDGPIPASDYFYLCEDDYVYDRRALEIAVRALDEAAAADRGVPFFTLYDHPDLYRIPKNVRTRLNLLAGHHWREARSTCMTFGGSVGTLRADRRIHQIGTIPNTPRDQRIWHATLGIGPFALLRPFRNRRLISAVPSLATHVEEEMLALGADWEELTAKALERYAT